MLQPILDLVLVEEEKVEEERTAGGLFVPGTANKHYTKGKVVAVGEGHLMENGTFFPLLVKVGDTILFDKHSVGEVEDNGKKLLLLHQSNIKCKVI